MGGWLFHQQQDEQYSRLMTGSVKRLNGCITISDYFPKFTPEELAGKDFFEVGQQWIEDFYRETEECEAPKKQIFHLRDVCYIENNIPMEEVERRRLEIQGEGK